VEVCSFPHDHCHRLRKTFKKAESPLLRVLTGKFNATLSAMKMNDEQTIYQTAGLSICPHSGQVRAGDELVRLGPINMKVLVFLLKNQSQVVSRAALFDGVWGNQVVSDDVLTRCISDLRASLGGLANETKLIETLPKRGYRWLPGVVCSSQESYEKVVSKVAEKETAPNQIRNEALLAKDVNHQISSTKRSRLWTSSLIWMVFAATVFLLLSSGVLWLASQWARSDVVAIAILPIETTSPTQAGFAANLEESLQKKLLKTNDLRYLARSAVINKAQNPFPYFSREFGVQWLIEGRVRQHLHQTGVSLSLIDAHTATVSLSKTWTLNSRLAPAERSLELEKLTAEFVGHVSRQLK